MTTGEKYAWNNKQKAIAEGRGITITTEANADTVSLNLPIYEGGGDESIQEGRGTAFGDYSHAEGNGSVAAGDCSHAEGINSRANGFCSHAECWNTTASGNYSHAEGSATTTSNNSEHASGQYNESNRASTTFGDSGNTLFSVGNGTADNTRHNAFEIRQNGDIYLTLGGQDVKLQDNLGNKVDNTTTVNGHALSGNVTVTKSDVGLGNVGNYKAVSTEANQGLTSTEQSNARANIGAGTSNFSGSYNDLSDKPTIPTVYTWAQASTKPTYTLSEVGATVSVSAISSNTSSTCSITGSGNAGKIQTIIYTNSTSSDLTVTVPTTYTTPDGAAIELTCPSGGYCEVSYLNVGGTIYARGI